MNIDQALAARRDDIGRKHAHESGADDQVGGEAIHGCEQGLIEGDAVGECRRVDRVSRHVGAARDGQGAGLALVAEDANHLRSDVAGAAGSQYRGEIGAASGGKLVVEGGVLEDAGAVEDQRRLTVCACVCAHGVPPRSKAVRLFSTNRSKLARMAPSHL